MSLSSYIIWLGLMQRVIVVSVVRRGGKKERISESLQRVYISVPSIKENEKRSDEEPPKDKEIEKE